MRLILSLLLGNFIWVVFGAHGQYDRMRVFKQSQTVVAPTPPTSDLVWGDINILHTTDMHGWLGGHTHLTPPEPNYSGDLGTFSSFVTHMKAEASKRNVDLLLVDTGDLHVGNGLTDGAPPGEVNSHKALKIIAKLPYDLLTIGNNELNYYSVAYDIYQDFAPKWKGRYLTSNVEITVLSGGKKTSVPIADRFVKFKTPLGRQITALGVLCNFTDRSLTNITVDRMKTMVNEPWFKDAISQEPDLFLLAGHMPVNDDLPVNHNEWPVVFKAIRAVHPYTLILILGGKCPTRAYPCLRLCIKFRNVSVQLDGQSMSLESGRYMETIGWMSAKLDKHRDKNAIVFNRRYLDANPVSYLFHTKKTNMSDFDTPKGLEITEDIKKLSKRFNLDKQFSIAPQDYFLDRVPYPSDQSVLSLLINEVLPTTILPPNPHASIPRIFILNSATMRSDLFKGPFTRNDQYLLSPRPDAFQYIQNVLPSVAEKLLDKMNNPGLATPHKRENSQLQSLVNMDDVTAIYRSRLREQWDRWNSEERDEPELTPGYVTQDRCPGMSDDIRHSPLPSYWNDTPTYIGSTVPQGAQTIDVVFIDFIQPKVLTAVNTLLHGVRPNYTTSDVSIYSEVMLDQVFGLYAQKKWNH